jgi:predicted nucleotidyltransferase
MLRGSCVRYDDVMSDQCHAPGTSAGGARADRAAGGPDPAIPAIRQFLRGRTDVRLAIVFGSRVRGTATPASDVDIAVHAPGVDLLGLAADLSRITGHEVDVVDLEDAGVPMLARIVREGVGGHEATPGALAAWRARALADLETDRPWFARMRDAWLARVAAHGA